MSCAYAWTAELTKQLNKNFDALTHRFLCCIYSAHCYEILPIIFWHLYYFNTFLWFYYLFRFVFFLFVLTNAHVCRSPFLAFTKRFSLRCFHLLFTIGYLGSAHRRIFKYMKKKKKEKTEIIFELIWKEHFFFCRLLIVFVEVIH